MIAYPNGIIVTTTALTLATRAVGAPIGHSIYCNIFANKLKDQLPKQVEKFALGAGLQAT